MNPQSLFGGINHPSQGSLKGLAGHSWASKEEVRKRLEVSQVFVFSSSPFLRREGTARHIQSGGEVKGKKRRGDGTGSSLGTPGLVQWKEDNERCRIIANVELVSEGKAKTKGFALASL